MHGLGDGQESGMTIELIPEAFDAAWNATPGVRPEQEVWIKLYLTDAIKAYLDHPAADLVPRKTTVPEISSKDIAEWHRPRDVVIAETAMRAAQIERDEARRFAAENGKMLAALRNAAVAVLKVEDGEDIGHEFDNLEKAVRGTAAAAAQWVRVPEDCAVMPLALLRRVRQVLGCPARSTRLTRELIHLGDAVTAAEAMIAAAPQAGEPEGA